MYNPQVWHVEWLHHLITMDVTCLGWERMVFDIKPPMVDRTNMPFWKHSLRLGFGKEWFLT